MADRTCTTVASDNRQLAAIVDTLERHLLDIEGQVRILEILKRDGSSEPEPARNLHAILCLWPGLNEITEAAIESCGLLRRTVAAMAAEGAADPAG